MDGGAAWRQANYRFADLKELLAKATPPRSGDVLAGVAATSAEENVAAKMALADVPLEDALRSASLTPAQFLGVENERGAIVPGARADLVALTDKLMVAATWIDGEIESYGVP